MGLCAVCGVTFDVVDVDPRNGGLGSFPGLLDLLEADAPEIFGRSTTHCIGVHYWIAHDGTAEGLRSGIHDQAGDGLGEGRGFVFLPPTVRPSRMPADRGALRPYHRHMPVHGGRPDGSRS